MKKYSTVILYHAYGLTELYQQVLFSLLTLYYHLNGDFGGIGIVIYTDKPKFFEKYTTTMPICIEPLSKEAIAAYKGKHNFVHRVKIRIIQDCFSKFNTDILYLDSDTYFTKSPIQLIDKIDFSTSIMNSNDYNLISADELFENLDWLKIRRAIMHYNYIIDRKEVTIPLTTQMWNAGVIGLSLQNAIFLEQILDLTDQIYINKNVFTAEQFAFSYFLQNKTNLISSGDTIFHYWKNFKYNNWKQIYNHHFHTFFRKNAILPVTKQASLAFKLTQQNVHSKIPKINLLNRLIIRLKLIAKITIDGHLS